MKEEMSLGRKKKTGEESIIARNLIPLVIAQTGPTPHWKARFLHRYDWGILLLKDVVHARILGSVTSIFVMLSVEVVEKGSGEADASPPRIRFFQFHLVSLENWSNRRNRGSATASDNVSVFAFNTNCWEDNLPIQFLSKTSPHYHLSLSSLASAETNEKLWPGFSSPWRHDVQNHILTRLQGTDSDSVQKMALMAYLHCTGTRPVQKWPATKFQSFLVFLVRNVCR